MEGLFYPDEEDLGWRPGRVWRDHDGVVGLAETSVASKRRGCKSVLNPILAAWMVAGLCLATCGAGDDALGSGLGVGLLIVIAGSSPDLYKEVDGWERSRKVWMRRVRLWDLGRSDGLVGVGALVIGKMGQPGA